MNFLSNSIENIPIRNIVEVERVTDELDIHQLEKRSIIVVGEEKAGQGSSL